MSTVHLPAPPTSDALKQEHLAAEKAEHAYAPHKHSGSHRKTSGTAHAFAMILGEATAPALKVPELYVPAPQAGGKPTHEKLDPKLDAHLQSADKAPGSELKAKPPEPDSKPATDEATPTPAFAGPAAPSGAKAETVAAPPPAPVRVPVPTTDSAPMHGSIQPQAAHLHMDVGPAGDLSLHLRMKEGVADVRLDGTAARAMGAREPELRLALTSSGVAVNRIEIATAPVAAARDSGSATSSDAFAGQSRSQSDQSTRDDQAQPEVYAAATPKAVQTTSVSRSAIDVKA